MILSSTPAAVLIALIALGCGIRAYRNGSGRAMAGVALAFLMTTVLFVLVGWRPGATVAGFAAVYALITAVLTEACLAVRSRTRQSADAHGSAELPGHHPELAAQLRQRQEESQPGG